MSTPDDRIDGLEHKVDAVLSEQRATREELGRIQGVLNGRFQICDYEKERIDKLENTVGKQNFVAALVSAVVAGVTAAIVWIAKGD